MAGPFVPDTLAVVTVPQLAAAFEALGIDPAQCTSLIIWPDHVSYEIVEQAADGRMVYETHTVKVAR